MAFRELRDRWLRSYPNGVSKRYIALDIYDKMLDGSFYDILPHPFEKEQEGERYIPLKERRPLLQYSVPVLMRDRQAAQIFGRQSRPRVRAYAPDVLMDTSKNVDQQATSYVEAVIKQHRLYDVMSEALEVGQSGSVAIIVTALDDGSASFTVVAGKNAFPVYDPRNPNKLKELHVQYPISGADLNNTGSYPPGSFDDAVTYWFRMVITGDREQWYMPLEHSRFQCLGQVDSYGVTVAWEPDDERSYDLNLPHCPAVWIRNLNTRQGVDGRCTFQSIVDLQVTMDYLASCVTRGFVYTSDPFIAINRGEMDDLMPAGGMSILDDVSEQAVQSQEINRNPARAMTIPPGSKAELLEMAGNGLSAAKEWFKSLRDMALEMLSGSKAGQEKTGEGNPHSGRALEVLNSLEMWLLERQSAAYGDTGLIAVLRVLFAFIDGGMIKPPVPGVPAPSSETIIELMWPRRTLLLGQDLASHMGALQLAAGGSIKEPLRLVPQDIITADAMAALGHPDPATNSEQVMAEWIDNLKAKTDATTPPQPKLLGRP